MKPKTIVLMCLLIFGIVNTIIFIILTINTIQCKNCAVDDIFVPFPYIIWGFLPFTIYFIWSGRDDKELPTTKKQVIRQSVLGFGFLFIMFIVIYIQFLFMSIGPMEFLAYTLGFIIPIAIIFLTSIIGSHKKN